MFGTTATNLAGPGSPETSLPSLGLLIALLAIRFNWARAAAVIILGFLTILWLPGALANMGEPRVGQAVAYVLIGTAFFAVGTVLVYLPQSNEYYGQIAQWRTSRKQGR